MNDDELINQTHPYYNQLVKQGEMRDNETIDDKQTASVQQPVVNASVYVVNLRLKREKYRALWEFADNFKADKWAHKDKRKAMKRARKAHVKAVKKQIKAERKLKGSDTNAQTVPTALPQPQAATPTDKS